VTEAKLSIACVASVPERYARCERNSGRAKEVFAFGPREKWDESKKVEGAGWGRGNACPQTLRFWKTCSPTNGVPDWCGMAILIDKCIKFASWTFSSRRSKFSSNWARNYGQRFEEYCWKSAAKSVRARFILAVHFAINFGRLRKSIYGLFRHQKFM